MPSRRAGNTASDTAESRFGHLASPLIDEAMTQAAALDEHSDPEVLHKMRVALRRLRTLFWAYRPLLDDEFDTRQRALFKYLANAAGSTRDWDILRELLNELDIDDLDDSLKARRAAVLASSIETLSNADVKQVLVEALKEANRELNTGRRRVSTKRFARRRVGDAQDQLKTRIKKALRAGRSDYAAYHEVRKAGKKVRYLIEFFGDDLASKKRGNLKALKRLQKRFGALNDVVASRNLLANCESELAEGGDVSGALSALKTEQKHRFTAARKALA